MRTIRPELDRLRARWPLLVDLALTLALMVSAALDLRHATAAPQPWTVIIGVGWMALMAFRSTLPLVAVIGMAAGCLAYAPLRGAPPEGDLWSFVAVLVIAFTAGSRLAGRRRWWATGALLISSYVMQILTGTRIPQSFSDTFLTPAILVGVPFLAGSLLQRSRHQTAELRRLQTELEAEREVHAAAAAAQERTRIARELHDVISHSVSVMVVQAGAAELQLPVDSPAREQLHAVRATGKQALVELRRQLGVLRAGDSSSAPTPIPTIADLDQLRGPNVRVEVAPELVSGLPPGLAQTVFRLVQESVTNARRHAAGAAVEVRVRRDGDQLGLDIVNGPGRSLGDLHLDDRHLDDLRPDDLRPDDGGHGLRGMAERVDLYSGRLETGPTADGGWRVSARLPIAQEATA